MGGGRLDEKVDAFGSWWKRVGRSGGVASEVAPDWREAVTWIWLASCRHQICHEVATTLYQIVPMFIILGFKCIFLIIETDISLDRCRRARSGDRRTAARCTTTFDWTKH